MSETQLSIAEATARFANAPIIQGRPNRGTIEPLIDYITNNLRTIHCYQSRDNGWAALIQPQAVQLLNTSTAFVPPTNPGPLVLPDDVTRGAQANLEAQHALDVIRFNTYRHLNDAVRTTLERCIAPMYRPEAIGTGDNATWPNDWTALQIIEAIHRRYQKVSPAEKIRIQTDFLSPFDQNQPIEMLFSRHENHQKIATIAEVGYTTEQLISNVVDRLRDCHLYNRAIENWDALPESRRSTWQDCKRFFQTAYQQILSRPAAARNEYANYADRDNGDDASLADTVIELGTAFHSFGETHNSNVTQMQDTISNLTDTFTSQLATINQQIAALSMNQQRGPPPHAPYAAPAYAAPPAGPAPPPYTAPTYPPHVAPPQQRGSHRGRRNGRNQQPNATQRNHQYHQPPPAPAGTIPPYQPPNGQQHRSRRNNQRNYVKYHNNWYACYSCGFDVDHESHNCPNKKSGHQNGFNRQNHQEYERQGWPFCKKGIHKNKLPAPR